MGFSASVYPAVIGGYESLTGTGNTSNKIEKQGKQLAGIPVTSHTISMPERPHDPGKPADTIARDNQRRKRAANAYGRTDTILTGSLGIPDEGGSTRKVLLGL